MAEKTLRDFSIPSAANVGDVNFELKSSLINMVQPSPFCCKPNKDANAHLQNFLELCKTVTIRGVTADAIRLCLFLSPSWGKRNSGFIRTKKPSVRGTSVPRRSSLNSSH